MQLLNSRELIYLKTSVGIIFRLYCYYTHNNLMFIPLSVSIADNKKQDHSAPSAEMIRSLNELMNHASGVGSETISQCLYM